MPSPVEISLATPVERAAILGLHREAGWPGADVGGEVWAAREDGDVVGGVQLISLAPRLILIDAAVVRADARGRGIGAETIRSVLATREAQWWLECRAERIAFYERCGFVVARDDAIPAIVSARVGVNPARRQFFLQRSTLGP